MLENSECVSENRDMEDSNSSNSDSDTVNTVDSSVEEAPKKRRGRPRKNPVDVTVVKKKRAYTQRNANGLGTDHPYESVNMECEAVEYERGIEAPF